MIILAIAIVAGLGIAAYLIFGRTAQKAAIVADDAREANAALKLAAYLKYCADNNLVPYADGALAISMLT